MIITFKAAELKSALKLFTGIIPKQKGALEILKSIRIRREPDGGNFAELFGTNLDMSIKTKIPATFSTTEQAGELHEVSAMLIPFAPLAKLAARSQDELPITISGVECRTTTVRDGHEVPITYYRNSIAISGAAFAFEENDINPESMPEIEIRRSGECLPDISAVCKAMAQVEHCMSNEETRYYLNGVLNGVCLHTRREDGALIAVSTDGHRLAMVTTDVKLSCAPFSAIIPVDAVKYLTKHHPFPATGYPHLGYLLSPAAGSEYKWFAYQNGNTEFITKLIDGPFPEYQRVIPRIDTVSKTYIAVHFKDPAAAIKALKIGMQLSNSKAAHLFPKADASPISLKFGSVRTSNLTIDASEFIEVSGNDATRPVLMAVNSGYLLNMLKHYPDSMTMHQNGAGDHIVITGSDQSVVRVLMPMRSNYA